MSPSVAPELEQRLIARERLRLLALGYFLKGGVSAVFVSFFLIHFVMFLAFSIAPPTMWNAGRRPTPVTSWSSSATSHSSTPATQFEPPVILFRIFAAVIGVIIILGWTFGGLTMYAGRCIQKRKHKTFVYVMAGLNCVLVPYGTLLGVATFIVTQSPAGRREFPGSRDEVATLPTA